MNSVKVVDGLFYVFMIILGIAFIALLASAPVDRRAFEDIAQQCETMGYIQDKVTRIKCSVEK